MKIGGGLRGQSLPLAAGSGAGGLRGPSPVVGPLGESMQNHQDLQRRPLQPAISGLCFLCLCGW